MLNQASQKPERQERRSECAHVNEKLSYGNVVENRLIGVRNRVPALGRFYGLFPFVIAVFHSPNIIHTGVSVNG